MKAKRGFSLIGALIVLMVIILILAIAIPHMLLARMKTNENAAKQSLNSLHEAVLKYSEQCKDLPPTLESLGPPANGCKTVGLIDADLASGKRGGYVFSYAPFDADRDGRTDGYTIIAAPAKMGTTGRFAFFINQRGEMAKL